MKLAYKEALKAYNHDEVPVGCVIVKDNKVIARAFNKRECSQDVSAHAELLAIKKASKKLGTWRLEGCTLYSTLEPCIMCSGAIISSRIDKVVFGAKDNKWKSLTNLLNEPTELNHKPKVTSGVLLEECTTLIQQYFKDKR